MFAATKSMLRPGEHARFKAGARGNAMHVLTCPAHALLLLGCYHRIPDFDFSFLVSLILRSLEKATIIRGRNTSVNAGLNLFVRNKLVRVTGFFLNS